MQACPRVAGVEGDNADAGVGGEDGDAGNIKHGTIKPYTFRVHNLLDAAGEAHSGCVPIVGKVCKAQTTTSHRSDGQASAYIYDQAQ